MTARRAGRRLVDLLTEDLPAGVVWTAREVAVLGLIAAAADRAETLRKLLRGELARPEVVAHRCAELSSEIRQSENAIAKMISTGLDPQMQTTAKSVRHQDAARARWNNVGVSGGA